MGAHATAVDLHRRATELANAGDLGGAEALLRRALPLAVDVDELALVDGTLAFVEAEQGAVDAAGQRCDRALSRAGMSAAGRATLVGQVGYVRWLGGRARDAVVLFSEALEHLTGPARDRVLNNRGVVQLGLGELDGAAADFATGLGGSDALEVAKCAHNLGYVHLLRGELVDALQLMDGARPTLDSLGPFVTAPIDIDRCEALEAAGLRQEAVGLLREVRDRLADSGLWRAQSDVDIRLARLTAGPAAVSLAQEAAARCAAQGNAVEADRAAATELELRLRTADPPSVGELTDLATRLEAAEARTAARALRIHAAGLRGEAPGTVGSEEPLANRLLAGEVGAAVALAAGDTEQALRRAAAAIDELEEWQRHIGSLELQGSTLTRGEHVVLLGQRAALASGDPAALLEWSERAREVAARGIPPRPPDELGDLLARLRHLGPEGDQQERARLIDQIRRGRWRASGAVQSIAPLSLDGLRTALVDARFVSILRVADEVVALVVAPDEVEVLRLGPWPRLASLLTGLPADLALTAQSTAAVVRRSLGSRLAAIDAIVAPAFAHAGQVVLTVPDELARIPWGQLASLRGTAVALPLSATAWASAPHRPITPGSVGVVLGPGTRTGAAESTAVAAAWQGVAEAGVRPAATCAELRALADAVDVLHVCAHGRDREGHRLFAATELHDGPWFGHDVEPLRRVPEVVVLSACGVGGGSLGMARAWLHAGARHVIAAPSDISESAAAERFPRLHELLAHGVAPADAVAQAFGADALDCAVQCYGPSPTAG
ncbi:CHAT domain-containing protein [Nocardioides panacisoli]|uniref:CHAT domain-containing protein n=1 Tax=Nocardioides panacisoli TaxID=627624 RepID=UPI001C639DD1|nr:CHAT domain-containing protein [Nocardioides panacisoli]QYJ05663.1 CHAT domain-containing protein [Nocardioides panacisoli]